MSNFPNAGWQVPSPLPLPSQGLLWVLIFIGEKWNLSGLEPQAGSRDWVLVSLDGPWNPSGTHRIWMNMMEQNTVLSLLPNPTSSHQHGRKKNDLMVKPVNFEIKQTCVQSLRFCFFFNPTVLWLPANSVTSLYFCLFMCKMVIKITTTLGSFEDEIG